MRNKELVMGKKYLYEISFMRPILIVLLVIYHAFAISAGWKDPKGYVSNMYHYWIAESAYSIMLESFVFISGYIFAFQILELKKQYSFFDLISKKSKRLLLPFLFWGIVYIALFFNIESLKDFFLNIINCSIGHLWFLPMLFWCFIFMWFLNKTNIHVLLKWGVVFLFYIFSFQLPFRIGTAMYYFLYFFLGYNIYGNAKITSFITPRRVFVMFLLFIVLFIILFRINNEINIADSTSVFSHYVGILEKRFNHFIYSIPGTLSFWGIAVLFTKKYRISDTIIKLGETCFGIYILQQFILFGLYYYTGLSLSINNDLLPWVGFIFALFLSYICTCLLRKHRLGKLFVG